MDLMQIYSGIEKDIAEIGQQIINGEKGLENHLAERISMLKIRDALMHPDIEPGEFYLIGKKQKLCPDCRTYYPVITGKLEEQNPEEKFLMCPWDGIQKIEQHGRNYKKAR